MTFRLLQRLNDNGGSTTTTIADTGATNLALLLLKYTEKGCGYPST
jgi:hypothetical protein